DPPPAGEGDTGNLVLATHDFRPSFAKPSPRTNVRTPIFVRRHRRWTRLPSRSCSASQERKEIKGSGTPKDAGPQPPRLATRLAPCKARSPSGVPPRLSPKGIIPSQRLGFRPGFLGRGLNGRYRPSPFPVQGFTPPPGRNAGRQDAQAARERTANPPASTAPAPPHGLPPVGVPWLAGFLPSK